MTGVLLDAVTRSALQVFEGNEKAPRSGDSRPRTLGVSVTYVYAYSALRGSPPQLMELTPNIEDLLGYSLRDWEVNPYLWQRLLHPEDAQWVVAAFWRTTFHHIPYDITYRMVTEDAQLLWIHDVAEVETAAGGTFEIWRGSWTVVPEPVDRTHV